MTCGIYKIYCKENNRTYIGSSNNIERRFREHISNLKNNKHPNKYLQNSWNKYKENSFIFEIIEICEQNIKFDREQFHIDKTKKLFNSCKTVVYNKGVSLKKETRIKISITLKNRELNINQLKHIEKLGSKYGSINGKKVSRKIKVITNNNIEVFNSVTEASNILEVSRSLITHRLRGRTDNKNKEMQFYYAK